MIIWVIIQNFAHFIYLRGTEYDSPSFLIRCLYISIAVTVFYLDM